MPANRILFVDDEYNLRLTLPQILRMHGYEVCAAATVAQALTEITTHPYDILISDLNIGEAGDGFTVVSAMRRTQPDCINIILTGYPAFECALAAIQRQVDDYLVKPARVGHLVNLIQERMQNRRLRCPVRPMRLSELLRANVEEIRESAVRRMKSDPALGSIPMGDETRASQLHVLIVEIANQMDSAAPDEPTELAIELSRERGAERLAAGYKISMLVTDTVILEGVVYDLVRERLLLLDTSNLVIDLKRLNSALDIQLQQSVQAFWDAAAKLQSVECGAG